MKVVVWWCGGVGWWPGGGSLPAQQLSPQIFGVLNGLFDNVFWKQWRPENPRKLRQIVFQLEP